MPWKREQILARLFAIYEGIPGIQEAVHNRAVTSEKRPALQLFDSDEVADKAYEGRGRPSNSPNFVIMSPETYVVLKNVRPVNDTVGIDLNTICAAVIKAVITDQELNELVGSNGEIRYDGLVTDLGEDRTVEGKARIGLSFKYVFRPDEL
jgi:hypothetical protein